MRNGRARRGRVGALGAASLALALVADTARAVTYDLVADEVSRTFDTTTVELWGFGLSGAGSVSVPGPVLEVPAGEDLVVNLTNQLSVPISVVVPGLGIGAAATPVLDGNGRVQSFSASEALPAGGTASYTFPAASKPGTYLYESGTDPALQIPMGLYGAVIVRSSTSGQAYDDLDGHSAFDAEQVLVLSEVDPALADAVETGDFGTAAFPSTVNYAPRFFLINGESFSSGQSIESIGTPGDRTLLRLLNAGSLTHAPTLTAFYLQEIAQDGNLLRFPQERLTTLLHAGQTKDVLFANPAVGNYALYDRRLFVEGNSPGGMIKRFRVRTFVTFTCGLGPELSLILLGLLGLRRARRGRVVRTAAASLAGLAISLVAPHASAEAGVDSGSPSAVCIGSGAGSAVEIRERWGVEIVGVHLTAAGHLVDFRYRVLDPDKARPLLDRQNRAELLDQGSGAVLFVPHAAKIGTLRQNTANPRVGRVAYALFSNPQGRVQPGRQVTIRIGDFKIENLTVQ